MGWVGGLVGGVGWKSKKGKERKGNERDGRDDKI